MTHYDMIPFSVIIGYKKVLVKVNLEGMVGKYLANLNQNKTMCAYILNVAFEAPEKVSA